MTSPDQPGMIVPQVRCRSGHQDCTTDCGWCKGTGLMASRDQGRSWQPAEPVGWAEEHTRWQRLILRLLRRPHCSPAERTRP